MEHEQFLEIKGRFEELGKQSSLNILVPRSTDVIVENVQRQAEREVIFFDELSTVYVVLKAQGIDPEGLLSYLQVVVTAHATTIASDGHASTTVSKHEVASKILDATACLKTARAGTTTNIIWKQELHITRPRGRSQNPAIYFTATLTIKPDIVEHATKNKPHYLPSLEPLSPNVLESLQLGQNTKLFLSESRITKVSPPSPRPDDRPKALRAVSKKALPAVPAIIPRLRYTSLSNKILLSIQIEVSKSLQGSATIKSMDISVPSIDIKQIGDGAHSNLQAGDELDLIYELVEQDSIERSDAPATMSITIKAAVVEAEELYANLDLRWQTQIDTTYNPTVQYSSWSHNSDASAAKRTSTDGSVTFDFTTPREVKVDSTFRLSLRCVNHSSRTRRFAVEVDISDGPSRMSALAVTPHVRMDPIEAGNCGETVIEYAACEAGVLDLGLVHIVDLDSQDSILIESLPDVIAQSQS